MANLIRRGHGGSLEHARHLDPFEMMREFMQWDPFQAFDAGSGRGLAFVPSFEVKETHDGYLFQADLPGVKEKDLDISITGNRLTVSGKREAEATKEDERYYAYERSYGSFSRSFTLPDGIDADRVQAELKDGVLTLSIGKKPEVKARKIELNQLGSGEKAHA